MQKMDHSSRRHGSGIGDKEIRVILYRNKFVANLGEFTHGDFYFLGKVGGKVLY